MHRAEPAEDKTHDEGAATSRQRQRQVCNDEGQQSDQAAKEDAETDEDHVGHHGRPVRVAETLCSARHICLRADQRQQIATLQLRFSSVRNLHPGPRELLQEDAARDVHPGDFREWLAVERFVRDHDVEKLDRKIQQLRVVDFRADLRAARHEQFRACENCNPVALPNHRARLRFDDLAAPADAGNEDAVRLGTPFEIANSLIEEVRPGDLIGARGKRLIG